MAFAARNGEPAAVAQIKGTLRKDPSRANPHFFTVSVNGLVEDSLRPGPMVRKDVYPEIPKFVSSFAKASWGVDPDYVSSVVGRYPSLVNKFSIAGLTEIERLEGELVLNEALEPAGRRYMLKRLLRLCSDNAPVWQNWISQVSATKGTTFDVMINGWLNESIDWKERKYFDPTQLRRRIGVESAREFFGHLDFEHLHYFGLKLTDGVVESTGESFKSVFLEDPIKDANARAKALGVKFRFREWQRATPVRATARARK
jgi:hypothetical protein